MTIPTFPTSPPDYKYPIGWAAQLSTTRIKAWTARRTNVPRWAAPIYNVSLTYDFANASAALQGWQTLSGFWKQVMTAPGQFFQFYNKEDGSVAGQAVAIGDGTTTAFQLCRTQGGFTETVYCPVNPEIYVNYWAGNQLQYAIARTNFALWSNDLTQSVWTKTNMTAAYNQVGPDGTSNNATLLTATANSATVTQAISLSPLDVKTYAVWIKRISGSGAVSLTLDGGTTWTVVSITSAWVYYSAQQTTSNPAIGVKLSTSGDEIAVSYNYLAEGGDPLPQPSPLKTSGSTVTVVDYALGPTGAVTFTTAPASGAVITWTGTYNWLCQFDDDTLGFENFAYQFWTLKKLTFNTASLT